MLNAHQLFLLHSALRHDPGLTFEEARATALQISASEEPLGHLTWKESMCKNVSRETFVEQPAQQSRAAHSPALRWMPCKVGVVPKTGGVVPKTGSDTRERETVQTPAFRAATAPRETVANLLSGGKRAPSTKRAPSAPARNVVSAAQHSAKGDNTMSYTQDELDRAIKAALASLNGKKQQRPLTRKIGTAAHEAAASNGVILARFGDRAGFTTQGYVQPDLNAGETWAYKTYQYVDGAGCTLEIDPNALIREFRRQQKEGDDRSTSAVGKVNHNKKSGAYSVRLDDEHRINFVKADPPKAKAQ